MNLAWNVNVQVVLQELVMEREILVVRSGLRPENRINSHFVGGKDGTVKGEYL